jgi:hypothetical protein
MPQAARAALVEKLIKGQDTQPSAFRRHFPGYSMNLGEERSRRERSGVRGR